MRRTDPEWPKKRYFRTQERLFSMNGQWYFTTREGDVGPFSTRKLALDEVTRYASEYQHLERFQNSRKLKRGWDGALDLAILPKEEEEEPVLEELLLENRA